MIQKLLRTLAMMLVTQPMVLPSQAALQVTLVTLAMTQPMVQPALLATLAMTQSLAQAMLLLTQTQSVPQPMLFTTHQALESLSVMRQVMIEVRLAIVLASV